MCIVKAISATTQLANEYEIKIGFYTLRITWKLLQTRVMRFMKAVSAATQLTNESDIKISSKFY